MAAVALTDRSFASSTVSAHRGLCQEPPIGHMVQQNRRRHFCFKDEVTQELMQRKCLGLPWAKQQKSNWSLAVVRLRNVTHRFMHLYHCSPAGGPVCGRLWNLSEVEPCWRKYVMGCGGLWGFIASCRCPFSLPPYCGPTPTPIHRSFSLFPVCGRNVTSQVPSLTVLPCLPCH